jgi:hypothetical protein
MKITFFLEKGKGEGVEFRGYAVLVSDGVVLFCVVVCL